MSLLQLGGSLDDDTVSDDIEILNHEQSPHWVIARMKLPEPMRSPSLTISDDLLVYILWGTVQPQAEPMQHINYQYT